MEPVGFAYRLDVHDGCMVSVMNGHRMILISIFSLSVLTATCPGGPGLPGTRMSPFWIIGAKDDGGGGDNWSCKTCKAPVKSSPPNQHPAFQRSDAFLSPNQQCQIKKLKFLLNIIYCS